LPARTQSAAVAASPAAATPGEQLWVARYDHGDSDAVASVAISPDGTRLFVTGSSISGPDHEPEYATVAYSTATGARLWARRWAQVAVGERSAVARAVAVSPDGSRVFVTGNNPENDGGAFVTFAYDAATGKQVWAARYRGRYELGVRAVSMAVSRDGRRIFVIGGGFDFTQTSKSDYVTVGYRAATGSQLWARRYNGPADGADNVGAVAVSRDGRKVFVTGSSYRGKRRGQDYATLAYRARTGARLWVAFYNGRASQGDGAHAIAVGRSRVFVTGSSGASAGTSYATVAYRTATGARVWARRYSGPGGRPDSAASIAVGPGGRKVYVTGYSDRGAARGRDYATVAYRASTGARVWAARYNGPASATDEAHSVAVNPAGTQVFVTGSSDGGTATGSDYATVAYRASAGARLWASRYNGPGSAGGAAPDAGCCVIVSPDGTRVFVTGTSARGTGTGSDYATLAYRS
jgi:DNA-binding beta-propeller fold protein YncE